MPAWVVVISLGISGISILIAISGRGRDRIAEIAMKAVEDSGKFCLTGEQQILHEGMNEKLASITKQLDQIQSGMNSLFVTIPELNRRKGR